MGRGARQSRILVGLLAALSLAGSIGRADGQSAHEQEYLERWAEAIVLFGYGGEFQTFSRGGRPTAHWRFPWVAGLEQVILPPLPRQDGGASPLAWASDERGVLVAAFPADRSEAAPAWQLVALAPPSFRLLGQAALPPSAEPPIVRWDQQRGLFLIDSIREEAGGRALERRVFNHRLEPAGPAATAKLAEGDFRKRRTEVFSDGFARWRFTGGPEMGRMPLALRAGIADEDFAAARRLREVATLDVGAAEGWLASFLVEASGGSAVLLVPGATESLVFEVDAGQAVPRRALHAPPTRADAVAVTGARMLVSEVRVDTRVRADVALTGRLTLLDLAAGAELGTIADPRLAGPLAIAGPLCLSTNGDAVVAGESGIFLVRWSPRPTVLELLRDTQRTDWVGCSFLER